ncbi:hypothetical protein COLO4_28813 [Corchorus olitorius]|uniref:Uncharacterized protein n=1 Tax=Corchorus olitorius TaxID=93759 RepID=A0A1R3HI65_9ROSI|nr:hypothetical protein COLO4_28813 [Corchorus olitorius]
MTKAVGRKAKQASKKIKQEVKDLTRELVTTDGALVGLQDPPLPCQQPLQTKRIHMIKQNVGKMAKSDKR